MEEHDCLYNLLVYLPTEYRIESSHELLYIVGIFLILLFSFGSQSTLSRSRIEIELALSTGVIWTQ